MLGLKRFFSTNLSLPSLKSHSPGEKILFDKLVDQLSPSDLTVSDISGGCGAMYAVEITSSAFQGISLVRQHKLVTEVLKDDIKAFHGIQIKTHCK